jgi:hypothetical protein
VHGVNATLARMKPAEKYPLLAWVIRLSEHSQTSLGLSMKGFGGCRAGIDSSIELLLHHIAQPFRGLVKKPSVLFSAEPPNRRPHV